MAKSMNTADPRRVADIAEKLRQACGSIGGDHADMLEAQEQVQALSGKMQNTRLSVAQQVAAMAHAEGWTNAEINEGCAAAAKGINAPDGTAKTIGVFISEMRTFANPKVRDTFPTTLEACQEAWAAEQEDMAGAEKGDSVDTPVRKFKKRLYHLVMDVARQIKKGELSVDSAEDVVRYCRENDPDFDAEKVAKRLAGIIGDLDKVFSDFGMGSIQTAADFLRTIKAEELLASRKLLLAGAPIAYTAPPPPPPPAPAVEEPQDDILDDAPAYDPEPVAAPVEAAPEPEPRPEVVADVPMAAQESVTIMEGAVDIGLGDDLFDPESTPTLTLAAHALAAAANAANAANAMAEAA